MVLETADDFITLLSRSRLLADDEFRSAVERMDHEMLSPSDVADKLVADGTLTRYQANRLLEGRRRGLPSSSTSRNT